jgi:Xaa-Pro aminopeptidase
MSNVKKIQEHMGRLDALLLTDPISIRYASGFYITDGAALIAKDKAWLITDFRYAEAAGKAVKDMEILSANSGTPLKSLMSHILAKNTWENIGAEAVRMTVGSWTTLEKDLGVHFVDDGNIVGGLRAGKEEWELTSMIAAQRVAEKALSEVLGILKPGMTEKAVAAELVYRMYKYGGEANSFDPIVVTGHKTSLPHGVPGEDIIADGDFVTMDFGTMVNGYCSDMTRTVAVGHATEEMKKIYGIVLQAQQAGIGAAKPGVPGRDIDAAARKVIAEAGYGPYFGHSFGHSLGLEIHEAPNASPSCPTPMPEGAVISAEPGIYIPGKFGVRIEDVLWLRSIGTENITKAPKELIIL